MLLKRKSDEYYELATSPEDVTHYWDYEGSRGLVEIAEDDRKKLKPMIELPTCPYCGKSIPGVVIRPGGEVPTVVANCCHGKLTAECLEGESARWFGYEKSNTTWSEYPS